MMQRSKMVGFVGLALAIVFYVTMFMLDEV